MIMTVEELKKYVDTEEKDSVLEATQNDAQKDTTSAADPLLRNAIDKPADTNESSGYTAPDDNTLNN